MDNKKEALERIDRILQSVIVLPTNERAAFLEGACNGNRALRLQVECLLVHYDRGKDILEDPLNPARKKTVLNLLELLSQKPESEQQTLLFDRCRGDQSLVTEVLSLLRYRNAQQQSPKVQPDDGTTLKDQRYETFAALKPGVIVGQVFRLVKELGRGGFGVVFLCERPDSGWNCAAKFLLQSKLDDPTRLQMFQQEILRWVEIGRHPNIVLCYGTEHFLRLPFVLMEYVPGAVPLSDLIDRGKSNWQTALSVGYQVVRGLEHAHKVARLIHRDLKPQNVLIDEHDRAKVTDFGISISQTMETNDRRLAGTPAYIAPECWLESPDLDFRSDIYALGVMLFEVASGRRPFPDHQEIVKYAVDHLHASAPDVRSIRPDIPEEVAALISRCLEKRPAGRPASFAELADEISSLHIGLLGRSVKEGKTPDVQDPISSLVMAARTYADLGMTDAAIRKAREALEVNPFVLDAMALRAGETLFFHEHLQNDYYDAWNTLGQCLAKQKQFAEAVHSYLQAYRLLSNLPHAPSNIARTYFDSGNIREAVPWLMEAIAKASRAGQLGQLEGTTILIIDLLKPEIAVQFCDRIHSENPSSVTILNNQSILFRRMQRYADALASASRAVELNPSYAMGWTSRANALLGLRRYEEAIESAEQSLKFDRLGGAYIAAATALMNINRSHEAGLCLREGLEALPHDQRLLDALRTYGLQ